MAIIRQLQIATITADTTPGELSFSLPRDMLPHMLVAYVILEAAGAAQLVYASDQTEGHNIPAVAADEEDFPTGSWRWGAGGKKLPRFFRASAPTTIKVMLVEVDSDGA